MLENVRRCVAQGVYWCTRSQSIERHRLMMSRLTMSLLLTAAVALLAARSALAMGACCQKDYMLGPGAGYNAVALKPGYIIK